jgi:hypothetical protein
MNSIQQSIVILYGLVSLVAFVKGWYEVKHNANRHGLTPFGLLGIFIWTDAVVIGLFWVLASIFILLVDKWLIGLLIIVLFWVVRSAGEALYWILQQFATKKLDEPETVPWHNIFPGQSVYIAQQVWWQMVLVTSLLATILVFRSL